MDAYIDAIQNCISILWQFASRTQFNSVYQPTYDQIQILHLVHPLQIPYYNDLILDSDKQEPTCGREVTPPEHQGAMTNCMRLLAFNIDNDFSIVTNFSTVALAHSAITGMKLQYAPQELGDFIMYYVNKFIASGFLLDLSFVHFL
ncbi:MAG: hypothetical protein EZS28_019388, partial [Streblomastix strix]